MSTMQNPFPTFPDWNAIDYRAVFAWRQQQIMAMRARPALVVGARAYYATRPVEFIEHWCTTYDPRNAASRDGKTAVMPFILFKRQKELVQMLMQCLALENPALVEKCRDVGATWLCGAFSVWLWLFLPGASIGWGSRKEQLVDNIGDLDSIFEKIRMIIRFLPPELLPKGFSVTDHMPFMRVINPETSATISGESGDNIGRGGRKLIYFKDESAWYERPEKIEAALSENTRVQVDISSVNGLGNVFERRRRNGAEWNPVVPMRRGKTAVFIFDVFDHPGKTIEWYEEKRERMTEEGLAHIFAQEIDRNYASSVSGTIIKPHWIKAAIDAHLKLKFDATGRKFGGLDVADGGIDKNASAVRSGSVLFAADQWADAQDTGETTRRAAMLFKAVSEPIDVMYDSIGVGAGVKAEYNRLRAENLIPKSVRFIPWAASGKVLYPEQRLIANDPQTMRNEDYFANIKAQGWWQLARRFERTWRAVTKGIQYDPATLISLPSTLTFLSQIERELAQAVFKPDVSSGKTVVDKTPKGTQSPNLADAIVMAFWPILPAYTYSTL